MFIVNSTNFHQIFCKVFKVIGCCDSYNDLVGETYPKDFNKRADYIYKKNADNMARSWKAMCARHKLHWDMWVVADRASENIKALGVNFIACMCHGLNNALKFAIDYATKNPMDPLSLIKNQSHEIGKYKKIVFVF